MKLYYSEFVRHCLRYYIKTLDEGKGGCPIFKSAADRENWRACHEVLKSYPEDKMELISHIYRQGDTIADKIYALSETRRVSQKTYWSLIGKVEREIAEKRGLV